jgi:hypothetical protein
MPNGFVRTRYITVPAGSKGQPCKGASLGGSCSRTVYISADPWREGRFLAVDCDGPGCVRPSVATDRQRHQLDAFSGEVDVHDGKGLPHKRTCPDWNRIVADYHERNRTDTPARKRA